MNIDSTPRLAGLRAGFSKYQWLVLATCAATFALIVIGGIVRTTGSGDACPDWPRCHGQLLPPLETKVMIEFSHRLSASVVGFLVLGVAIAGWRSQENPVLRWSGVFAVGLVIAQVILGGATVLSDLSANVVMAHLALATTLFATLILLAVFSFAPRHRGGTQQVRGGFANLAIGAAIVAFVVMMTGAYVSGSGAALVFRDWPLFDGHVLPGVARLEVIHATHRLVVVVFGAVLVHLAWMSWKASFQSPVLKFGPLVALLVYLTQAMVGAANIWTLVQPAAAAAHVALAEILWAALITVAGVAYLESEQVSSVAGHQRDRSRTSIGSTAAAGEPS